jgi:uncharacterized membrane protein (DUF373 family)
MDLPDRPNRRALHLSNQLFETIEHAIYVVLGIVLSLTALMALVTAIAALWHAIANWPDGDDLLTIIDQLLFVLMMVEILHTVRVSITAGTLICEPFLIVGLIASIRRVLVITLESAHPPANSAEAHATFQATMIELGVLGGLILVMVISIYLLRRAGTASETPINGAAP